MNSLDLKNIIKNILLEVEELPTPEEETPEEQPQKPEQSQEKPKDNPEFINRTIYKREAAQIIKNTKVKYFTVSFTKKDGTNFGPREVNCVDGPGGKAMGGLIYWRAPYYYMIVDTNEGAVGGKPGELSRAMDALLGIAI